MPEIIIAVILIVLAIIILSVFFSFVPVGRYLCRGICDA